MRNVGCGGELNGEKEKKRERERDSFLAINATLTVSDNALDWPE